MEVTMIAQLAQHVVFCAALQSASVSVESVFADEIGQGWSARVLRNTIVAIGEPQYLDEQGFLRGGDLHTYVLVLLVNAPNQDQARVAWSSTETRRSLGPDFDPIQLDAIGLRLPTVEDVARHGESILILHIGQSENKLTIVERGPQPDSEWRTSRTFTLDLSSLAAKGQESVGLKGQIVQVNGNMYLHFSHVSIPGVVVFRVSDDNVSIETDSSVIRDVTEAVATRSDAPPSEGGSPATQPN
jgi:hypothetical protein